MDYEKAFKEAYERASLRFGTNVANELFLEYKESKEERTRRKLIEFFSDWSKTKSYCWGIRVTDIMDWLEKQGQKSAEWSEEDEKMKDLIISVLEVNHSKGIFKAGLRAIRTEEIISWLKSLKQRDTWKPSEEQMEALWCAAEKYLESDNANVVELRGKVLESLYNDLKKLKGE